MSWIWDKIKNEFVNPHSDLRHKIPKDIAKAASDFTGSFVNKKLPPNAKSWLNKYSNDVITKVTVKRVPVSKAITSFLNAASGNRLNPAAKSMGYDSLFHLSVVIEHINLHTEKVTNSQLEKLERVNFTDRISQAPNAESINVEFPGGQRIGGVVIRWMDSMGDNFYLYDAFANNCQTFIGGFIKALGASNAPGVKEFIYQDAKKLLEQQPGYLGDLAKSITNLGAIINQLVQGGAMKGGANLRMAANGRWELLNNLNNVVEVFDDEDVAREAFAELMAEEIAQEREGNRTPPRNQPRRLEPPPLRRRDEPPPIQRRRAVNPAADVEEFDLNPIDFGLFLINNENGDETESENEGLELANLEEHESAKRGRFSDDDEDELPPSSRQRINGGVRPPICRIGSKTTFVKLLNHVQPKHKIYVEPFLGSGAFYWNKEPVEAEVVNDLDKDTVHVLKLIKKVSGDIKDFPNINSVAKGNELFARKAKTPEEDFIRQNIKHCSGFYGQPLKPGGKIFKESFNPMSKVKHISEYKNRMKNTVISSNDYATVIKDWDTKETFFFLDPPYEKSTKAFGYAEHESFDFERFANVVKKIKGKFIVTINDSPKIRELFKGFHIYKVTVKGVTKHSKTGQEGIGTKNRDEILISNYEFPSDWKQHLGSARLMTGNGFFSDVYDKAKSFVKDAVNPNKVAHEIMKQVKDKDSFTRKRLIPLAQDIAVAAQPFIDVNYPGAGTAIKNIAVGINCANKVAGATGYGRKYKKNMKGGVEKIYTDTELQQYIDDIFDNIKNIRSPYGLAKNNYFNQFFTDAIEQKPTDGDEEGTMCHRCRTYLDKSSYENLRTSEKAIWDELPGWEATAIGEMQFRCPICRLDLEKHPYYEFEFPKDIIKMLAFESRTAATGAPRPKGFGKKNKIYLNDN